MIMISYINKNNNKNNQFKQGNGKIKTLAKHVGFGRIMLNIINSAISNNLRSVLIQNTNKNLQKSKNQRLARFQTGKCQ